MISVKVIGQGQPLVLLHGWGMHGGLMSGLADNLARDHEVYLVDLPGHGRSSPLNGGSFQVNDVLDSLAACLPSSAHWVGWSLGGLVSLSMALRAPERVRSLVLLATSPRFLEAEGWPGVQSGLLDQMGRDFVGDYQVTLNRFVGLQTFGQEGGRQLAKLILERLSEAPRPDEESLLASLDFLKHTDLRGNLSELIGPVAIILGDRDRLVPVAQASALRQLLPVADVRVIEGAAHLPFMTHEADVSLIIREFLGRH